MYTGIWISNFNYNSGDIVITPFNDYFICTKNHVSNNLTFPTKEDVYWVYISSIFLNMLIEQNSQVIEQKDLKIKRKLDNENDNDIDTTRNYKKKKLIPLTKKVPSTYIENVKEDAPIIDLVIKNLLRKNKKFKIIYQDQNFKKDKESKNELEIIREECNDQQNDQQNEECQKQEYIEEYIEECNYQGEGEGEGEGECEGEGEGEGEGECEGEGEGECEGEGEIGVFKRKLVELENEIIENKRIKLHNNQVDNLRDKILLMNIDVDTKSFILDKHDTIQKMHGSDYTKSMNWLKNACDIPYGINKPLAITKEAYPEKIKDYFKDIKEKLDESIHGLEEVKQEILEFVARKISNPESKGHILALYGQAGVGKSKILKTLGKALNLPFYQINFGGLNDVSILTGHSETYIGSKPGKIVEILQKSNCMNPIIYFDEIDKISENKAVEIYGILTHLLDEEQNSHFQDNYLSNINIDLSKVFFVLAFNDITKIDKIVCDRLKVIYIDPPNLEDKITICSEKMIPEILKDVKINNDVNIIIDKQVIEYIIVNKTQKEKGVRQLRKNIEKIANRVNYDILVQNYNNFKYENTKDIIITRSYIDLVLVSPENNKDYLQMYI